MAGFKISNDVGATVFAILTGLSALLFTAWIFGTGGCQDTSSPKITPVPVSVADDSLNNSSDDRAAEKVARADLEAESARRAELAADLRSSKADLGSLEEENATLQARLDKMKAAVDLESDHQAEFDTQLAEFRLKLKGANERNSKLKAQFDASASAKTNLETRIAELEKKLKALSDGKVSKAGAMAADLAALKLKLNAETKSSKDANASLLTLKQSATSKEKSLTAQIAELKLKLDAEAKSSKDAKASLLTLKQSATNKEKGLVAQIAELKGSMSGNSKKLSAELAALKVSSSDKEKIASTQITKLRAEVDALTKKLSADAKASLESKKQLMSEINQLNGDLDALKTGDKLKRAGDFPDLDLPMLVNDPLNLDAKLRPLFISLRGIKETVADRESTYKKITGQGNSSAQDVVQFQSGSAYLSQAEREELGVTLKGLGKNVRVLAVGYASEDGDAKSNHELSSKRASNVAQEVAKLTGLDSSQVQAVYFGQTKRFDEKSLSPNRIVEVWVTK